LISQLAEEFNGGDFALAHKTITDHLDFWANEDGGHFFRKEICCVIAERRRFGEDGYDKVFVHG